MDDISTAYNVDAFFEKDLASELANALAATFSQQFFQAFLSGLIHYIDDGVKEKFALMGIGFLPVFLLIGDGVLGFASSEAKLLPVGRQDFFVYTKRHLAANRSLP